MTEKSTVQWGGRGRLRCGKKGWHQRAHRAHAPFQIESVLQVAKIPSPFHAEKRLTVTYASLLSAQRRGGAEMGRVPANRGLSDGGVLSRPDSFSPCSFFWGLFCCCCFSVRTFFTCSLFEPVCVALVALDLLSLFAWAA